MRQWAVLAIVLLSSCKSETTKLADHFDREGHRGCRGLMPENTISAMIRAIDAGVNTLEMDLSFTSDMQPVLSHEPFFSHDISTKPDGSYINENEEKSYNIYRMTYAEVAKFDVGMKPHPRFPRQQKMKAIKPLLPDVIDTVENYCRSKNVAPVQYNIETKTTASTDNIFHPTPNIFVDKMMKVITSKNIAERVIIQSFDIRTLQYLHSKFPGVRTSLLIEPAELLTVQQKITKLGFNPTIISPEYHMVNDALVDFAHTRNMKIIPWTVNEASAITKLTNMGVDGIITDYPDLFNKTKDK